MSLLTVREKRSALGCLVLFFMVVGGLTEAVQAFAQHDWGPAFGWLALPALGLLLAWAWVWTRSSSSKKR